MDPTVLLPHQVELIEKTSLRALHTAFVEFGFDAWDYFDQSTDDPKDIAEDLTREVLDRFGGYGANQRIYGNVDYRKARFMILEEFACRQALFVDSKAEKTNATATIQMSQTSMIVRQNRGILHEQPGTISKIAKYGGNLYITTTLLAHCRYSSRSSNHGRDVPPYSLEAIKLAAIPNGILQDAYNPDAEHSIWLAGRNAPSRNEAFRVRLSFSKLKSYKLWRVQELTYDKASKSFHANWEG